MKIGVMGAGSIGTIIGGYLSDANEDVVLIDVNEEHVEQLNAAGASIIGTTNKNFSVKAITPNQMRGTYDVILLLTKQHDNEEVLLQLKPFLHEKSVICSLQNGVPESRIAAIVGEKKVMAGSVEFGATYIKPGSSELTSEYDEFKKMAFMIGELNGESTERIKRIKKILSHVGHTIITDNLMGTKWSKLVINVSMSGLSAALNGTYGDVLSNKFTLEYAIRLIDETVRVGHRKGIDFAIMFGLNFNHYLLTERTIEAMMIEFKQTVLPHSRLKASMLQDLEKGMKTEVDFINGVVVDTGKEVEIETPYNTEVLHLIKRAENEKELPDFEKSLTSVMEKIK